MRKQGRTRHHVGGTARHGTWVEGLGTTGSIFALGSTSKSMRKEHL